MKYIILLRDTNISGKNKIFMSDLKGNLESNRYEKAIRNMFKMSS